MQKFDKKFEQIAIILGHNGRNGSLMLHGYSHSEIQSLEKHGWIIMTYDRSVDNAKNYFTASKKINGLDVTLFS